MHDIVLKSKCLIILLDFMKKYLNYAWLSSRQNDVTPEPFWDGDFLPGMKN